jgi:DNA polymerase
MLDRLLKEEGLARERIMITNTVKCRPPENRRPLPEETCACFPYLEQELVDKQLIVAMGRTACENLLGRAARSARGKHHGVGQLMGREDGLYSIRPPACNHSGEVCRPASGWSANGSSDQKRFFHRNLKFFQPSFQEESFTSPTLRW